MSGLQASTQHQHRPWPQRPVGNLYLGSQLPQLIGDGYPSAVLVQLATHPGSPLQAV